MHRREFQFMTLAALGLPSAHLVKASTAAVPKIKIGQIGTKHAHASGQLEALLKTGRYEFVGIVEPDEAQWKRVQSVAAYQAAPRMTIDQLLNVKGIEAVAVETEVGELLNSAEQVINAGLHLHLDKPAGESFPQFKRIMGKAQNKALLVKMGYMFRYNSAFEFLFQSLERGLLGEVLSLHAEMSKWLSVSEREPMLRYSGGSMFELGCHLIDAVHLTLGKPSQVVPYIRKTEDDGFADHMMAVFEYPRALATVKSSFKEVQGGARRQFVVSGTQGAIEIRPLEPQRLTLSLDAPVGAWKRGVHAIELEQRPRYFADWLDFAAAIRGESSWRFSYQHDLEVQESVLRSSKLTLI